MLDAYIIDRIHREQQERARKRDGRIPLHIEPPRSPVDDRLPEREDRDPEPERGIIVIDFQV